MPKDCRLQTHERRVIIPPFSPRLLPITHSLREASHSEASPTLYTAALLPSPKILRQRISFYLRPTALIDRSNKPRIGLDMLS